MERTVRPLGLCCPLFCQSCCRWDPDMSVIHDTHSTRVRTHYEVILDTLSIDSVIRLRSSRSRGLCLLRRVYRLLCRWNILPHFIFPLGYIAALLNACGSQPTCTGSNPTLAGVGSLSVQFALEVGTLPYNSISLFTMR